MTDAELDALLDRHRAFWTMDEVDVPLERIGTYSPLSSRSPYRFADGSLAQEGSLFSPGLIDPQTHIGADTAYDSPAVSWPFLAGRGAGDLCWTEAIAGCPVLWRSGHVWAGAFLSLSEAGAWRQRAAESPWLARLLDIARLLVEQADGRYPVVQPLMRGPIDIAAGAVGDEDLCMLLVDQPEDCRHLVDQSTELFIAVSTAWRDAIPPFRGGYCIYGIWAPGTVIRTQCDNAALLSPSVYADLLAPCDERICQHFDYPLIHTHSCFIRMAAEPLLHVSGLAAIQVSLDYPGGPSVAELLETLQRINQCRPLVLTGPVTADELEVLRSELSPRGLSLQVSLLEEGVGRA